MVDLDREQTEKEACSLFQQIGLNADNTKYNFEAQNANLLIAELHLVYRSHISNNTVPIRAIAIQFQHDCVMYFACRDALKNRKFRDSLVQVIKEAAAVSGNLQKIGFLLYETAVKVSGNRRYGINLASTSIAEGLKRLIEALTPFLQFPRNALQYRPFIIAEYLVSEKLKVCSAVLLVVASFA